MRRQTGPLCRRMKQGVTFLGFMLAWALPGPALAAPPDIASTPPSAAGVVALSVGPVHLQTDNEKTPLRQGDTVQTGHTVVTGTGGFAHIKMADGGLIAIRPGSVFQLEVFDFRHDAENDRVRYRLEQGVARSITGTVGERNKAAFRLNTPVAAIGVRGTDFVVSTDRDTSRVAINSGAVVVAPLGGACMANAFGACAAEGVLLGSAHTRPGDYAEVVHGETLPRLISASSTGPDQASPPHPAAPKTTEVSRLPSPTLDPSDTKTPELIGPPTTPTVPEPPAPPPVSIPPLSGLAPDDAYWGRWSGTPGNPAVDSALIVELVDAGKKTRVVNPAYGAGVLALPDRLPHSGQISFVAAAGEGILRSDTGDMPLTLAGGRLAVDFNERSFSTQSQFDGKGQSYMTQAAGNITENGYFHSDPSRSNSIVTGALGKDLDSAVTTITRHYDDSRLYGAVIWGRQ